MTAQQKGLVSIAVVLVAGVALYMYTRQPATTTGPTESTASTTQTANKAPLPKTASVKAPSLDRPITISADLSADVRTAIRLNLEKIIAELKADPTQGEVWLDLGIYRKMGGDYQGAAEAWAYVAKVSGSGISFIAYGNLGDLYMNFAKDYPKAIANYKAALAIKPDIADYKTGLTSAQQLEAQSQ